MKKVNIYIFIFIICLLIISLTNENHSVIDWAIHILAALSLFFINKIIENTKRIYLYILSKTIYRNKMIRLSISYLFKIKVNDKYLLIKGNRINQFQPVGGVFKRFRESFYQLRNLNVVDDDNIAIDDKSIDDLRIKLPGQHLIEFLKWYESQLGREVSPYREFYEELIKPGILNQKTFPYINYIHLYRHQTKIRFSPHFQCNEILIAEIFELRPSEAQIEELKSMMNTTSEIYIWTNEDSIRRRGVKPGTNLNVKISETSEWIL
jgi:hypothetical protein